MAMQSHKGCMTDCMIDLSVLRFHRMVNSDIKIEVIFAYTVKTRSFVNVSSYIQHTVLKNEALRYS